MLSGRRPHVYSPTFGHFHIYILVFLGNITIFVTVTHPFTYIYITCDWEQRSSRSNPTWAAVTSPPSPASSRDAWKGTTLGPLIQIMKNLTKLWEDTVSAAESLMFTQPEKIEGNQLKTVFTLLCSALLCSPHITSFMCKSDSSQICSTPQRTI